MARLFSNRFQCFVVWIFLTTKRNILLPVNASFYLCTRTPRNIWYVGRVEGSSSLWKTAPNSVEKGFRLHSSPSPLDDGEVDEQKFSVQLSETLGPVEKISDTVFHDTSKSVQFSFWMTLCGGILGPFLDSYHSAFSVLRYDDPIKFILSPLGGTSQYPVLTTAWWVPELFGLAGFLIGWLYILYDQIFQTQSSKTKPNAPFILTCISFFTFQYWLSGLLYQGHFDRSTILFVMSFMAATGFVVFDRTVAGLITSFSTAIGGPLIEVGLISMLTGNGGYHYTDPGETGFFPLWISPGKFRFLFPYFAHVLFLISGSTIHFFEKFTFLVGRL